MKKITLLALVVVLSSALRLNAGTSPVTIISTRSDIFYFKLSSSFVGATAEVYSESGELIMTETIVNRKAIIDFYYENAGTYTIKIKKGGEEETFTYKKNNPSPMILLQMDSLITVSQ